MGYGKAGSFEGFCSGGGLKQLAEAYAKKAFQQGRTPSFCPSEAEVRRITSRSVAERAKEGREDGREIYRLCGDMLGRGLSVLIDILNPEVIVIGSIYARSAELISPAMEQSLAECCLPQSLEVCRIVPSALGETLGDVAALSVAIHGERGEKK